MIKVFISHNTEDKPLARRIGRLLLENGFKPWIDEGEIKPGQSLIRKITEGIHDSDRLIALVTPNSVNSKWVNFELEKAMTLEVTMGKPIVVPIVVSECKPPLFLQEKLYLKLANSDDLKAKESELLGSLDASLEIVTSPSFSNVRFNRDDQFGKSELETAPEFSSPVVNIRVVWDMKYPYQGMTFSRKWYRNGERWRTTDDVLDKVWNDSDSLSTYILNLKGHPPGKYSVRFFIDGEYQCTGHFTVNEN